MTRKKKALTLGLAASAVLSIAAASATYICWPAVVDQGGGVASSSSYRMRGSVGGPVIAGAAGPGTASSASYRFEVNSVTVLESGGKEGRPSGSGGGGGGGGGGGCCGGGGGAVFMVVLALVWTRRPD